MSTKTDRRNPLGFIEAEIDDLKAKHLYRPLRVMSAAQGPVTVVDGHGVTHSNIAEAKPERTLSIYDVRLHVLSAGDAFDLTERVSSA